MDLLASEYSWSFGYILDEVYPEDYFTLQRQILMRKIDNHLMELAVAANPLKPGEDAQILIEELLNQRRWYRGEAEVPEELDLSAFEAFREGMTKDSKFIGAR